MIFRFGQRRVCYRQKVGELAMAASAKAFGDIRRCRTTRAPDVFAEIAIVAGGRLVGKCVHVLFEFICKLPTNKIVEVADAHPAGWSTARATLPVRHSCFNNARCTARRTAPRTSHVAPRTSHVAPRTEHVAPRTSHMASRTA